MMHVTLKSTLHITIGTLVFSGLVGLALPQTARAQDGLVSTSTIVGTTTSGVLTTLGVVWLVMPKDKAKKALLHYMNDNQAMLGEVLVTGQGEGVADLASMSGIPHAHHERFSRALTRALAPHRDELLLANHYTEEHASIVLDAMIDSVTHDEVLREVAQVTMQNL